VNCRNLSRRGGAGQRAQQDMTDRISELRNRLGVESLPIEYAVDAGSIKYFADCLMDPDPRYAPGGHDSRAPDEAIQAPVTFFGSAVGLRGLSAGDPRTMSALDLPLPPGWARLATGDEFLFHAPLHAGMTLVARERLISVSEKLGRSGRLIFYSIEKLFSTPDGQPILRRILHCAAREPISVPTGHARRYDEPPMAGSGAPIPPLTVGPVTVRYLAMFATATAEYVDIHYDADYARSLGLPGPIIQGLYKTALIARLLKDWTGDGARVRSLNVQHRGMDLAGTVLTAAGAVQTAPVDAAAHETTCSVWVRNQEGLMTTFGTARVLRVD